MLSALTLRPRAALIHCLISLALTAIVAIAIWTAYPPPYFVLSGGAQLLLIMFCVDVAIGPLLTFVVCSPQKSRKNRIQDLCVIALLQLAALGYGGYTGWISRPVATVLRDDHLQVISAYEVLQEELPSAVADMQSLPFTGPKLVTLFDGKEDAVTRKLTMAWINKGYPVIQRPSHWRAWDAQAAWQGAIPVSKALGQSPRRDAQIQQHLTKLGLTVENTRLRPIIARAEGGFALINPAGQIVSTIIFEE